MNNEELIQWLLVGDASIQYQSYRDLLNIDKKQLRKRIAKEGWGARFLQQRNENGHWGRGFYQPKWTSTHYTILDLKNLAISPDINSILRTLSLILDQLKARDGGIYPFGKSKISDVCINGMFLNYACYFGVEQSRLKSVVNCLLDEHMPDGGFNCHSNREWGARHSSTHSTLSVLEGILEYDRNAYNYRLDELRVAQAEAIEFLLQHKLFRSHRTGEIIDKKYLRFTYPCRWRYDILRALDYFQFARIKYDSRMDESIEILLKKRSADGTWRLRAVHPGQVHFKMEQAGEASRWNTLRALRVLNYYCINN